MCYTNREAVFKTGETGKNRGLSRRGCFLAGRKKGGITIKTLAIRQPWISLIAEGDKTIEVRSWPTGYRGPLLLVASGKPLRVDCDGEIFTLPAGIQVCIADVVDCRLLRKADLVAACLDDVPGFDIAGQWAWCLANVRQVAPTPHKGRLRLYETPDEEIIILPSSRRRL